jgi:hypothetical protein
MHAAAQCRKLTEEIEGIDIASMMALYMVAAFHWVQYVDIEPFLARMKEMVLDELQVDLIAPTHGLVIGNPRATLPAIVDGMRTASAQPTTGMPE